MKSSCTALISMCLAWTLFSQFLTPPQELSYRQHSEPCNWTWKHFCGCDCQHLRCVHRITGSNQVGAYGFQIGITGPGTVTNVVGSVVTPSGGVSTSWAGLNNSGTTTSGSVITYRFRGGGPVAEVQQPYNVTIGTGQVDPGPLIQLSQHF